MLNRSSTALVLLATTFAAACSGQGTAERDGTVPQLDDVPQPPAPAPSEPWQAPAAAPPGSVVAEHGQLRVEGTRMLNAAGAPVQLKGVSTMWLNWEQSYALNKSGLEWMRDNWSIDVVRAAMGIEPNNAYLANPAVAKRQVKTVIQNAIDLGVYVIVDWHDHNAHLHQADAIAFFQEIATEYGSFPNVLYETYNEPTIRDSAGTNITWSGHIKPYHEAVVSAIRAIDPDNIAILGNRQWDQRPDEAAADPLVGTNLMYTVHFYSCSHGAQLRAFAQTAHSAGLPLFVTEWGATPADGGASMRVVCLDEARAWLDWMDQNSISWAAWKLDGCADTSCFFADKSPPAAGGWTPDMLSGHGPFVVERLLAPPAAPAL